MTNKKRLFNIFALVVLAVFAALCVLGFSACGSDYDDLTDDDAAELYATLVKTDEYEGSFTVVNTESVSYKEMESYDGEKFSYSGEYERKYTTSYDADSGYLVCKYDKSESWKEDDESETYIYMSYLYYVPGDDDTLTLYWYGYELEDGEEWESRTKENSSYSDYSYEWRTSLSNCTSIDDWYGGAAWTSVEDLKDRFFGDEEGTVEIGKEKKETVYRFSVTWGEEESENYNGETYSYAEVETAVLEFHVNSNGYITKYSFTESWSKKETEGDDYWEEEGTWVDEYEISYSFNSNLKLAEKDMSGYVKED